MIINMKSIHGWTKGFEISSFVRFGFAFLWYLPEKRFSVSVWTKSWSKNIRIAGPKKLSFEK